MLIDKVDIVVRSGAGGNGCVSFHREKYVSHGGPDGGDGGRGGDVIFRVDEGDNTLLKYRYHRKFKAENGENGKASKMHGKNGASIYLDVPPGTVIRDKESGKVLFDMSRDGTFVAAKGGRGGFGNRHFATSTRQTPRFAKLGGEAVERELTLELKMLADVGLVGFPNAGKSTVLSCVSAARPKIADYAFTTLEPMLGVVKVNDEGAGYVVADLPGLIEGAGEGVGLGTRFLKHIDRCRVLWHVVDLLEETDPVERLEKINYELSVYDPELPKRLQIVVGNKCDFEESAENREKLEAYCHEKSVEFFAISALQRDGLAPLVHRTYELLQTLPPLTVYEPEITAEELDYKPETSIEVSRDDDGAYVVTGPHLERFLYTINPDDRESMMYFQRTLNKIGVIAALRDAGIEEGDTVRIYDVEFDYVP
ncbi:MAG: GTPase ObgE [Clostridia bacterium]|nr:GTPase ObgE [Clostridia bacterium]